MGNIDGIQDCCRIVRIYVADEFCFHLEQAIFLCPVLQCQIHGAGTEVASADTDLYNSCEFFSCCICDLAGMNLICKLCDLFLLLHIECSLVNSVCHNSISQLSAGQMMKNKTFFSCIDHFSIVKSLKLIRKLCLFRQLLKTFQDLIVHLLCRIIVGKTGCHRDTVFFHTIRTIFTGHNLCELHTVNLGKLLIGSERIKIAPGNHNRFPPHI